MRELIFWKKIAKHLSGNASNGDLAQVDSMLEGKETQIPLRDASILFGKSKRDVQDSFKKLEEKLRDC